MKIALVLMAAASAVALALPAQAAPHDIPCILISEMRNHTVGDDHALYFDVSGRATYRAVMSNNCLAGAVSSDPIVLRDRFGTGRICNRIDLDVSSRGARCIVQSLTKLTPAEAAALPNRVKP
jgi:hypothetical protein